MDVIMGDIYSLSAKTLKVFIVFPANIEYRMYT